MFQPSSQPKIIEKSSSLQPNKFHLQPFDPLHNPSLPLHRRLFSQLPAMSNCTVESCKVETSDGVKLHTRVFKPKDEEAKEIENLGVVLVHPYSILGGCQGLLRGIAAGLAERGYKAVTFDMRGAGKSSGRASLTGFAEIKDVIAVCKWVCENLSVHRILLVGSSAGMCFFFSFCCGIL